MSRKLTNILSDLIADRTAKDEVTGGLMFQFQAGDHDMPFNRLLCYRREKPVGTNELVTLRRHLEKLLPNTEIFLGPEFEYTGSDKIVRKCRAFSWPAAAAVSEPGQQVAMDFDAPKAAV
jgi:hypothetical protein